MLDRYGVDGTECGGRLAGREAFRVHDGVRGHGLMTQRDDTGQATVISGEGGDPLIGAVLGNYVIDARLGQGGFGTVYRARDTRLERNVAIKFLVHNTDSLHLHLFEREAKAIAALDRHPSIIKIHTFGEHSGRFYFVMEFMPGSVANLLAEYPDGLPMGHALAIAERVADALHYAHTHAHGVLHRDVKPENILADPEDDSVKLADFGLVSLYKAPNSSLLDTGISGTPAYMSPEQATGQPLDCRTDVYSLGVTLYQMLSGRLPVEAGDNTATLGRVAAGEAVPFRSRKPACPEAVLALVERAMAYDRDERFESAGAFAEAIRAVQADLAQEGCPPTVTLLPPALARPVPPKPGKRMARLRHRSTLMLTAAVVAVVLAVVVGALVQWPGSPQGFGVDIAQADSLVDAGRFAEAKVQYETLAGDPELRDLALYGLGTVALLENDPAAAEARFSAIESDNLRQEGLAAVQLAAHGRPGDAAQTWLSSGTAEGYGRVIEAGSAMTAGDLDQAVALLAETGRDDYRFAWQYEKALEVLGQALFRQGAHGRAAEVFQRLADQRGAGNTDAVGEAYLRRAVLLAEKQHESAQWEAVKAELRELAGARARLDTAPLPPEAAWTSRPLSFAVLLPDMDNAPQDAAAQDLAGLLPLMLPAELGQRPGFVPLGRDVQDVTALLTEQAIAQFAAESGEAVDLGVLLSAQLLVRSSFVRGFGTGHIFTRVFDSRTGHIVGTLRRELPGAAHPAMGFEALEELLKDLADDIVAQVRAQVPLRGVVAPTADGGWQLNIGADVGVQPGMHFSLAETPDGRALLPGCRAVVSRVHATTADVDVDGPLPEPAAGPLYAEFVDPPTGDAEA